MGTFAKNGDGLNQHFGTRDVSYLAGRVGGVKNKLQMIFHGEKLIDDVTATDATKAEWVRGAVIPSGAIITSAKLVVTEAFTAVASTTPTLDIGVFNADTGAAIDDDGIDSAVALASVLNTVGELVTCDGASVAKGTGATALSAAAIIAPSYDTAAFTGGTALLEVEYTVPVTAP